MHAMICLAAMQAILATHQTVRGDDVIQKEMAHLQGTWQLLSMEIGGIKEPNENISKGRLIVKGNKIFLAEEEKTTGEGTFKIVEVVGKTRKTDITLVDNKLFSKIFALAKWLDDDTFMTCLHLGQRPTTFTSTPQNMQILMVFKRVKK